MINTEGRKNDVLDEIRLLLDKKEPKEAEYGKGGYLRCPRCHAIQVTHNKYCPDCGQRLVVNGLLPDIYVGAKINCLGRLFAVDDASVQTDYYSNETEDTSITIKCHELEED